MKSGAIDDDHGLSQKIAYIFFNFSDIIIILHAFFTYNSRCLIEFLILDYTGVLCVSVGSNGLYVTLLVTQVDRASENNRRCKSNACVLSVIDCFPI